MDEIDLRLLRLSQDGLAMVDRPYLHLGKALGISEDEVIGRLKELERVGIIRRFAATIGHRALGITANAMIIWRVPLSEIERIGELFASFEAVTHCYERAIAPDWPYNLYTMVHSRNKEECIEIANELSRASDISDFRILFSVREYKKTSARI
ncbi:MAG: siroheme decarboxylase subunit beta [Methanotrichaceae archaeon]